MFTKPQIYNLALQLLLLERQISDPDTDRSKEAKALNAQWEMALFSTLEDLDLDSTSTPFKLELYSDNLENIPGWQYAYKYPSNCAFFRRIKSCAQIDSRHTFISKRVGMYEGQKVIFTNEWDAVAEIIPKDIPISSLSANTVQAIACRLASLASPLIVGKGAARLRRDIEQRYVIAKAQAQEQDRNENFDYVPEEIESEFVYARTT